MWVWGNSSSCFSYLYFFNETLNLFTEHCPGLFPLWVFLLEKIEHPRLLPITFIILIRTVCKYEMFCKTEQTKCFCKALVWTMFSMWPEGCLPNAGKFKPKDNNLATLLHPSHCFNNNWLLLRNNTFDISYSKISSWIQSQDLSAFRIYLKVMIILIRLSLCHCVGTED